MFSFFIKSFKEPSTSFDIRNFIQFSSSRTRSATYLKMKYPFSTLMSVKNFYFNRLPRLWNSLPPIDLDQPLLSIKKSLRTYFWNAFTSKFNVDSPCTYHLVCPCSKCALLPYSSQLSFYHVIVTYTDKAWLLIKLLADHQYRLIFLYSTVSFLHSCCTVKSK